MSAWSVYSLETGLFTGQRFAGPDSMVEANTPQGCAVIAGRHDKLSQRVDIETRQVVAYERPQAEVDAERSAARKAAAIRAIESLERSDQPRAVREALLALLPDGKEKTRLQAIEDEIATKRADLLS